MQINEKQKNNISYYGILAILTIAIFTMFRFIPVINDAWASYFFYSGWGGLLEAVSDSTKRYLIVNGRILATIVCAFFEQNDILLDIGITATYVGIIWYISKGYEDNKRIFIATLTLASLLWVSTEIRVEVYFYATLIYLIPILIVTWAGDEFQNFVSKNNLLKKEKILAYTAIFIASSWIENVSVGVFCAITTIMFSVCIKNRKLNVKYCLLWLVSGLATFIILFSTVLTRTRVLVSDISLMNLATMNSAIMYHEIFDQQKVLIGFLAIIAATTVWNSTKNIWFKRTYAIGMSIVSAVNILGFILSYIFPISFISKLNDILWKANGQSISAIIKCLIMVILFMIPIFIKKDFIKLLFLYLSGVFSLIPSLLTPNNVASRISSFAVFMLIVVYIYLAGELRIKTLGYKIVKVFIIVMLVLGVDKYFCIVGSIDYIQNIREFRIEAVKKEQALEKWDYNQVLHLPSFPGDKMYCGASFVDGIHAEVFKMYYGLDERTKIDYYEIK